MKKGISIHIGLNDVDEEHYGSGVTPLETCEQDAIDMQELALAQNFKSTFLLLSENATRAAVKASIKSASVELVSGDILFLSYSGHGGFVPDLSGDEENDNLDETWCLYDGQLLDDELYELWAEFEEDVRIVMLSDSCHSGTVAKANMFQDPDEATNKIFQPKLLSYKVAKEVYFSNKDFYTDIESTVDHEKAKEVKASIKLLAGCQDPQVSYTAPFARNSIFTEKLLKIWDGGQFVGDYSEFLEKIKTEVEAIDFLPTKQTPNLYDVGKENPSFNKQKPFQIYE
ncbi:MAG: caspase family protein [Epsilonproteobacteria bacterium]|nr:caspase family protein [Campylobacterota bacterium]